MTWVSAATPGIAIAAVFGNRGDSGSEHYRLGRYCENPRLQCVAQSAHPVIDRDLLCCGNGGGGKTGDPREVFGTGAPSALLASAAQQRRQLQLAGND